MGWTRENGEYRREVNNDYGLSCYSEVWYNLHSEAEAVKASEPTLSEKQGQPVEPSKRSSICQAMLKVRLPITEEGEAQDYKMLYAKIDSCSSADICASHLLHNIKSAQEYGRPVIRMKQAHGTTPWYEHCGELHALDEHDRLMKRIYYAQETPVHGDDNFILTGMNTILDLDIDIKHHMRTSIMPGIRRLRRGKPPGWLHDYPDQNQCISVI
jgi:hypothetical protein